MPVYLPHTDKNHRKIIHPFWQKKSHFEKIWEHFLYFSQNFPRIFVSARFMCLVYIQALNIAAMDAPFIIIFLHYLYKYFSDKGNEIESMHNDKTLDYVLFSIRDCSLTLSESRGFWFSGCEDFYNRAYIVFKYIGILWFIAKHFCIKVVTSKKAKTINYQMISNDPMKTTLLWDPILDMPPSQGELMRDPSV